MARIPAKLWLIVGAVFFFSAAGANQAAAELTAQESVLSLFGSACEAVRSDEAKSSTRVRASDKASFTAVEKIPELSEYRNTFSGHDFNVLVYYIVDNYFEDLTVKTVRQDDSELCVEVSGYLNSENILKALNANFHKLAARQPAADNVQLKESSYPAELEVEKPEAAAVSAPALPPKPQPRISPEISADRGLISPSPADHNLKKASAEANRPAPQPVTAEEDKTTVFIEKTRYFNNTESGRFGPALAEVLKNRRGIKIINDKNSADYLLRSNVLRAKVDPLNQQTRRLQMVIAVELVKSADKSSIIEHQNRFILFESSENEQEVAARLIEKLMRQAAKNVASRIKVKEKAGIITPSGSNYGVFN